MNRILTRDRIDIGMETHLANGQIGLGCTTTGISPARSFMIGVNDLHWSDAYRMALLPTWNAIEITCNGHTLALDPQQLQAYKQQLDCQKGQLTTRYIVDIASVKLNLCMTTILLMHDNLSAIQSLELESNRPADLVVRIGIYQNHHEVHHPFRSIIWPHESFPSQYGCGFDDPRMKRCWHPGNMDVVDLCTSPDQACWAVTATTHGNGPAVGIAMAADISNGHWQDVSNETTCASEVKVRLNAGQRWSLDQYVGFSRDHSVRELKSLAALKAQTNRSAGKASLQTINNQYWDNLWKGHIEIHGDDDLQDRVMTDQFYLYQNTSTDPRYSFSTMGLSSPGYWGSTFWDTECFITPAILPFHPDRVKSTITFRKRILSTAYRQAQEEGYKGARYSWQSEAVEGTENSFGLLGAMSAQIHINADIVLAAWWYFCATRDHIYLRMDAWPIIQAVADFFASRVMWIPYEDRYELPDVCCVEEAEGRVTNCLYTNHAARCSLWLATEIAEILGIAANPLWKIVADKLHVPFNDRTGLYQAHSGISGPERTRYTVTCAAILWGLEINQTQIDDALSIEPISWNMSYQVALAAMAGQRDKVRIYLDSHNHAFSHEPYFVRTEQKNNDAGPFMAGSGAHLNNLIYGCGGLRWNRQGLSSLHPVCLPEGIERIVLYNTKVHDQSYDIELSNGREAIFHQQ